MEHQDLFQLFIDELEDMYSSEHQIIDALPKVIKLVNLPELKEAITKHLKETEGQVRRIDQIFSILDMTPEENTCEAMEGLIREVNDIVKGKSKSPLLDAAIISALQKIEHYEIASYGTLRSFANYLDLDSEIVSLIKENLDEEGAADKKLTKIAEGSIFVTGVNKEAARGR